MIIFALSTGLLAVHISNGALATSWFVFGYVAMIVILIPTTWRIREEEIPRIGVLVAAFFVASQLHIKLGFTSTHLILNGLVGVILGIRSFLAIATGLLLQAFLTHHGGIDALGVNACVIGLPALVAGALYPLLRRLKLSAFLTGCLLGGGAVAASAGLNFLVLLFGGKDDWQLLAKLVLLSHIPIVLIEGLMLGVIIRYLEKVKPEMLRHHEAAL